MFNSKNLDPNFKLNHQTKAFIRFLSHSLRLHQELSAAMEGYDWKALVSTKPDSS